MALAPYPFLGIPHPTPPTITTTEPTRPPSTGTRTARAPALPSQHVCYLLELLHLFLDVGGCQGRGDRAPQVVRLDGHRLQQMPRQQGESANATSAG